MEPSAARQAHLELCTDADPMLDILCHLLVSRVRLRVVLVSIKHHLVKPPVMLLMLATMFLAQPNRARLLVLQEPSAVRQERPRVQTLQQDILCQSTGQSSATACSPGFYQASSGQTSCELADAGHYVDQTGQSSQNACSVGTLSRKHRPNLPCKLHDADAGYFVVQTGQSSQTACAAGTFSKHRFDFV